MAQEAVGSSNKSGILFTALGWVFFAISLLFMPLLFGAAALAMGFMTYHERSQVHGIVLMLFAAASMVLGTMFSFFVAGTMFI